jgi:hypothetical protein
MEKPSNLPESHKNLPKEKVVNDIIKRFVGRNNEKIIEGSF